MTIRTSTRRVVVGCAIVSALTLTGCTASPSPSIPATSSVATTTVRHGVVTSSTLLQGALGYGAQKTISAVTGGTLTAIAAAGSTVTAGSALYSVDNVPVTLLAGPIPAWRTFAAGMTPGPDITQLLENLLALGYFTGTPGPKFSSPAAVAVSKWQKATGQTVSGSILFGAIVFAAPSVRVAAQTLSLGAPVTPGSAVLTTTAPDRVVSVPLPLSSQGSVKVGDKVTIQLPDGSSTAGTVATIASPTKSDDSDTATVVIPVTIAFDDPTISGAYTQGTVTVTFAVTSHDGVLSVPVEALLASGANQFAVKAVDSTGKTSTIPVTVGLFGGGRVEVSGAHIIEGLRVQVAS